MPDLTYILLPTLTSDSFIQMPPKMCVVVLQKKREPRAKKGQETEPEPEPEDAATAPAPSPVSLQRINVTGVLKTPSTQTQKRKLSSPRQLVSEESDANSADDGHVEVVHKITGGTTPKTPTAKVQIKKRFKVAARGDLPFVPVISIEWVPEDMKVEILKANGKGNLDEAYCCVRWYMCVIILVRCEMTTEDWQKLVMMLFGMNEVQASLVESGQVDKREHFGVKIGRKIKMYYNGLMEVLRKSFDALLAMFWKSDIKEIQDFIEGQFDIWKVTSLANARRSLAKVGIEEVNRPII